MVAVEDIVGEDIMEEGFKGEERHQGDEGRRDIEFCPVVVNMCSWM